MQVVLSVMAASILLSSMFMVSGRMSTYTILAPRWTKASAVDTKVKEGRITSSPAFTPHSSAASSRALVQEVVSSTLGAPVHCSSH